MTVCHQELLRHPYIVDNNLTEIAIKRSSFSKKVDLLQNDDYKLPIVNELKIAESNSKVQKISFDRLYGEESSIVNVRGEISRDELIINSYCPSFPVKSISVEE